MQNGNRRPKKKTPWQHRCDLIQSISFKRVAREVDAKRMKETGQPLEPDQRANGARMKRLLVALHRRLGNHAEGVVPMERLASDTGYEIRTARRGISDLEDAFLIDPDRERERPRRYGGQGPSLYKIVWSTVNDLARTQGLQPTLFDDDRACDSQPDQSAPAAARHSRPPSSPDASAVFSAGSIDQDEAVASPPPPPVSTPGLFGRALGQVGRALGQVGRALGQVGRAPGQKSEPNAHAGASFTSKNTSSPPSPPEQPIPCPAPFTQAADPLPAESKEKKNFSGSDGDLGPDAGELVARLDRYGVYYSRRALSRAQARGWTCGQIAELLGRCEAHVIVVAAGPGETMAVYAWPPALVQCHLSTTPPGAPIQVEPHEAFVRARRDRDLRLAAEREAARRVAEERAALLDGVAAATLREEAEDLFAALGPDDVAALRAEVLARYPFLQKLARARRDEGPVRRAMIEALKARVAQARSEPEGDG